MIKLVGESLKQYDLNRQVEIIPAGDMLEVKMLSKSPNALPVCFEEKDGRVYACIPDILLKSSGVITVETLEILDDGSQIEQRQTFDVSKGNKPKGYECPKPEILTPNHLKNNGGGGGVSSWNDLTDKPFEETTVMGDTLTWDGDMTGKVSVEMELPIDDEGNTAPAYFVKVSDSVPTIEDLEAGGSFTAGGQTVSLEVIEVTDIGSAIMVGDAIFIAKEDNVDLTDILGVVFPEKGVYFINVPLAGMSATGLTINNYTGFESTEIKPIDPKYLPSDGFRTYFYDCNDIIKDNVYRLYVDEECETLATWQDIENAHNKGQIVVKGRLGYSTIIFLNLVPSLQADLFAVTGATGDGISYKWWQVGSAD